MQGVGVARRGLCRVLRRRAGALAAWSPAEAHAGSARLSAGPGPFLTSGWGRGVTEGPRCQWTAGSTWPTSVLGQGPRWKP